MSILNHLDVHRMHLIKSEIQEVYLNLIIQSFALSLITVFVPIYLLQIGYSLNSVFLFMMIEVGTLSFFTPFSVMLAQRFGFKHIILYRAPVITAYFIALYIVPYYSFPIYFIALVGGISGSMYWMSLHSLFAKYSDKIHRGAQAGRLTSLPGIASLLAPSIGGIVAYSFGFRVLFILAIAILILSVVPLFFTGDMKPHVKHISYSRIFRRKNWKILGIFAVQGSAWVGATILWPVYIYIALMKIESVGFATTIASFATILFTFYIGSACDRVSRKKMLRIGGLCLSATLFMMMFAETSIQVYSIAFLSGLFLILVDIPIIANFYDLANSGNLEEYIVLRQFGLGIGRVASLLVVLWAADKFTAGFSLAGLASLVFSFI